VWQSSVDAEEFLSDAILARVQHSRVARGWEWSQSRMAGPGRFWVDTDHSKSFIAVKPNDFPGSTPGRLGRLEVWCEWNEFRDSNWFVDPGLLGRVEMQGGSPGTVDVRSEAQDLCTGFCPEK
jgi:hypothetical protein